MTETQSTQSAQNTQGTPQSTPPPTHLVWAILTTIFCCTPFGIPAIVYAAQVESLFYRGQVAQAKHYSEKAKMWSILAAASILLFAVAYFGFIMIMVMADSMTIEQWEEVFEGI